MEKKLSKFKSKEEREKFETFLRYHVPAILLTGGMGNYYLRHVEHYPKIGGNAEMSVIVDPKYLDVTLNYSEDACSVEWEDDNTDELIRVLCHECAHIVTTEFVEALSIDNAPSTITHHEERLTEHVSRWLYQAYKATLA